LYNCHISFGASHKLELQTTVLQTYTGNPHSH